MSLLQNSNAIEVGGYTIGNSLRFRSSASAYLNRTPASAGNRKTWTWSAWVKRGALATTGRLLTVGSAATDAFGFTSSDTFQFFTDSTGQNLITSQVFRDPSAWYHIIVVNDTTQATAANRVKLYLNGSQITAFGTATYPAQNSTGTINSASAHNIARRLQTDGEYFDGYLAEVNFIDGQALTPSSFGETNTLTGQWVAKRYTGTYGTNGFYLPFSNTTSATTLAYDASGNGNNWTANNISTTAGVTYDAMIDSPSLGVSGTQPVGNYCVGNPNATISGYTTFTNGNLQVNFTSSGNSSIGLGTTGLSSGKWYWEGQIVANGSDSNRPEFGVVNESFNYSAATGAYDIGAVASGWTYRKSGNKYNSGTSSAYGASYTTNDVIGIALDMDAKTITFYKNGVSQGQAFNNLSGTVFPAYNGFASGGTNSIAINFGQRPFAYTPPTGFKALCTTNLPDSTIVKGNQYMDATTYTGNGSTQTITNAAGFSPDLVWAKCRSSPSDHALYDTVRGIYQDLASSTTGAETTQTTGVTAFNSNGFTTGSYSKLNANGPTYVAWQWDAGSSTVTNTSGSITSQVRANPTAGVSVVTWTGTGANATVGHGLGIAPSMIIVKYRNSTGNWQVYHSALGNTRFVQLNTTIASTVESTMWNNTSPTSNVFTTGTNFGSLNMVAYCFAEISGFSKAFSYTGNGSADGPFLYLGFRPKFIMIKRTDAASDWFMYDTSRSPYNVGNQTLTADTSTAEGSYASTNYFDFVSNGFKIRQDNASGYNNASGGTYIGIAFAENPFKVALAR